nr:hypothetical protein [Pseudomonas lundensis]
MHNDVVAEQFRSHPAYAAKLLAEVRQGSDPCELYCLEKQLFAAFGRDWLQILNTPEQKSYRK